MKTMFKIIILTVISAMYFITASGQDKKAAAARKELSKAKTELRQAKIDSAADYQKFKEEAELSISENEKEITSLKSRSSRDYEEMKMRYDKKVGDLEQKNNELKAMVASADVTETSKWTTFKHDFRKEMNDLGNAMKELADPNNNK